MKKRLNILCVIVLLVLSYSVLETTYYVGMGVVTGFRKGFNEAVDKKEKENLGNMQVVQLMPEDLSNVFFTDSVYNEKSGAYVPVSYGQLIVSVDTSQDILSKISSALLSLLNFVVMIWAVVLFIRLIAAINRSDIFNWKNVRRLRSMGTLLVVSFGCSLFGAYLTLHSVEKVFAVPGYSLSMMDMVHITSLVLGLSALIVAEVFAIGLKMKEEQDLTI